MKKALLLDFITHAKLGTALMPDFIEAVKKNARPKKKQMKKGTARPRR